MIFAVSIKFENRSNKHVLGANLIDYLCTNALEMTRSLNDGVSIMIRHSITHQVLYVRSYCILLTIYSTALDALIICTTFDEVTRAAKKLKNGRAAGSDEIPPELLKCALPHTAKALHSLFQRVWCCGRVPAE